MSMFFDAYTPEEFKAKWGTGFKSTFTGLSFAEWVPREDNPKKKKTIRYVFNGEFLGDRGGISGTQYILWSCPHCDKVLSISHAKWARNT